MVPLVITRMVFRETENLQVPDRAYQTVYVTVVRNTKGEKT